MDIDERFDSRKYFGCYPGFPWKGEIHSPCLCAFRLRGTGVFFPRTPNSQAKELEKLVEGSCRSLENQLPLFLVRFWRIRKATHLQVSFKKFVICKFCQFRKTLVRCPIGIGSARRRHKISPKKLLRKHRALFGFHLRQLLAKKLTICPAGLAALSEVLFMFLLRRELSPVRSRISLEILLLRKHFALRRRCWSEVSGTFRTGGIHIRPS